MSDVAFTPSTILAGLQRALNEYEHAWCECPRIIMLNPKDRAVYLDALQARRKYPPLDDTGPVWGVEFNGIPVRVSLGVRRGWCVLPPPEGR
jgi:hypothetical protein